MAPLGSKPLAGESPRQFVQPTGRASTIVFGTIAHAARVVRPAGILSTARFGAIAKVAIAVLPVGIPSAIPQTVFRRASTATYFDVTGALQLAAVDTLRPNYDPITHVQSGNIIEGGTTNFVPNGNSPFSVPWVVQPIQNSAGTTTDIPGLFAPASVIKHVRNTNTADNNVGSRNIAGLNIGDTIIGSIWVYIPSSVTVTGFSFNINGVSSNVHFDGVLANRNQWQRVWASGVLTANKLDMVPRLTGATGDIVYSTCWQLETGQPGQTTPTSYIPTVNAIATRAADKPPLWILPTINQRIHPSGIASTLAIGTPKRENIVQMSGIASTLAFGTIAGSNRPHPLSIASTLHFGVPKFKQNVHATGHGSTLTFGAAPHITQRIHPAGIPSHLVFGSPVITVAKSILQYFATATPSFNRQNAGRRISVPYGDGYNQVSPNGLTPIDRTLTLSWSEIRQEDVSRMVAVLRAHIGLTFSFVAPGETVPRKWLPTKWGRGHPYPTSDSFSITFEERPYINLVS